MGQRNWILIPEFEQQQRSILPSSIHQRNAYLRIEFALKRNIVGQGDTKWEKRLRVGFLGLLIRLLHLRTTTHPGRTRSDAATIENIIAKGFYSKLGLQFQKNQGYKLTDYIENARNKLNLSAPATEPDVNGEDAE